jgi:hypothetical protein
MCYYPQFQKYLDDVEKAARDCARAVRRLVEKGPPIWLSDSNALPIPEGDTHIEQVQCSCLDYSTFLFGLSSFFPFAVHIFLRFRMLSLFGPNFDGKDATIVEKSSKKNPTETLCFGSEQVWYAAENEEKSAKLKGTLEGEARDKLWAAQKEVLKSMEEAERAANPPSDEPNDARDNAAGAVDQ